MTALFSAWRRRRRRVGGVVGVVVVVGGCDGARGDARGGGAVSGSHGGAVHLRREGERVSGRCRATDCCRFAARSLTHGPPPPPPRNGHRALGSRVRHIARNGEPRRSYSARRQVRGPACASAVTRLVAGRGRQRRVVDTTATKRKREQLLHRPRPRPGGLGAGTRPRV